MSLRLRAKGFMGKCKFCGHDAGFLSSKHSTCAKKFQEGLHKVPRSIEQYLIAPASPLYADTSVADLKTDIQKIAEESYLGKCNLRQCVIEGWKRAVTSSVESELFPGSTERALVQFAKEFNLAKTDRNCRSAWLLLEKRMKREAPARKKKQEEHEAIIRAIEAGKPIKVDWPLDVTPFKLQKSERLVWVFKNTVYREEVLVTRAHKRYGIKRPATYSMRYKGQGTMGLTTRHIYFVGALDVFRIRYDSIGSISPRLNGIRIERYAQSARPQEFLTAEGWFAYLLTTALAQQA